MQWNITQPQTSKRIVSFAEMWVDLKVVIQSEVKLEREKQILYINPHMCNLQKRYS